MVIMLDTDCDILPNSIYMWSSHSPYHMIWMFMVNDACLSSHQYEMCFPTCGGCGYRWPLHAAAEKGDLEAVEELISQGHKVRHSSDRTVYIQL